MENKKLSWKEIQKQYDQEWVLLDDCEWPEEEIDPRAGIVRFHAKTRNEFEVTVIPVTGIGSCHSVASRIFPH